MTSFDGGRLTGDAGALLLGATDKVLGLTRRLAVCGHRGAGRQVDGKTRQVRARVANTSLPRSPLSLDCPARLGAPRGQLMCAMGALWTCPGFVER